MNLDVQVLPPNPDDPLFVKSLNSKPGILALAMNEVDDGKNGRTLKGIPFIVPGARFNEVLSLIIFFGFTRLTPSNDSSTTGILTSSPSAFLSMVK
jgi:neutral trehalase